MHRSIIFTIALTISATRATGVLTVRFAKQRVPGVLNFQYRLSGTLNNRMSLSLEKFPASRTYVYQEERYENNNNTHNNTHTRLSTGCHGRAIVQTVFTECTTRYWRSGLCTGVMITFLRASSYNQR